MTDEMPRPNLAGALAKVQAELPKLERDRTVTVEPKDPKKKPYSYSYVTLAHLSDAVLPVLAKHGLSFAVMPGTGSDGRMCIRYHLMHESGERLTGEFPISGEGGIQMIGGRITYARRYCLAAVVGMAADEDDESRLAEETPAPQPKQDRIPPPRRPPGDAQVGPDQHRKMHALWRELGYGGDENREQRLTITAKILSIPELPSSGEMTREQADRVIAALRERKAEQQHDRGQG